jgi:hypothetical protein
MTSAPKFDDLAGTTLEEDFFGITAHDAAPEESDDEEQLLKDGNAQVLKNFERQKKTREYSRSQTSRGTKVKGITMSYVDWSGFPGAAHSPATASERKQRQPRRSSLQNSGGSPSGGDLQRRAVLRSQRRSSAGGTATGVESSDPEAPSEPKLTPSGEGRKYRNRRHAFKASVEKNHNLPESAPPQSRTPRGKGLDTGAVGGHRAETQGSGSKRLQRQHSAKGSHGPRKSTNVSLRPISPSGRIRRPVAAAASSTTLEVTQARRNSHRSSSRGRKQASVRGFNTDIDSGLMQKASSIRW